MTRSMTAFARQEQQYEGGTLVWEIRSVNHRYLEYQLRLPESLRHLETALRDRLRKQLSRGKVECTLRLHTEQTQQSLDIDAALAAEVISAAEKVRALLPQPGSLDIMDVLRWPGVMKEAQPDIEQLSKTSLALFDKALQDLITGREREGTELQQMIRQRLDMISQIVAEVRQLMPEILNNQAQMLRNRLAELKSDLDPARLEQELVLLAQKADVAEELDRLETHVQEVGRVMKDKASVGRRLDFLMQELNREANTLSSKSIVVATTQRAVELKVLIEQMREQIQNIE
ncbi:YicC/YloC family endoribonuclease [Nitrincola alkalilacustris]|uniref:YicC/YloC family endoribonuclease n=1 Tax=Nitrincola alkalilacustris TaxID=1571224 RepID=UPI00124D3B22|nr:YicC/YloC family endoribonuclease [Nitrincola alkalilacustris]